MKKHGKFEKRKESAAPKQLEVKSMLLQTYFTSLLCLVLSVTMFMGTSYAWFTSEVTNKANEIYVGTLKVGLYKQTEEWNEETQTFENVWTDLSQDTTNFFDNNIRWEPGYTALETIKIVNEGKLAFKYVLSFTDGTITAPENSGKNLTDIAQYFDVCVYQGENPTIASYADVDENEGWTSSNTLDTVLSGKALLEGDEAMNVDSTVASAESAEDTQEEMGDIYTIALHMKENADASVMGHKISLNVKLVAYQMASETDDTGSTTYDAITTVSDAAALKAAVNEKTNVLLTSGIAIQNPEECISMAGGTLDGNGQAVSHNINMLAENEYANLITVSGGAISNLTVYGGANARALYTANLEDDLYVSDCVLSGAYAFHLFSDSELSNTGYTVNFTDTVFNSFTVFENRMEHAYFTDCTFNELLKPHGDTTLTNCVITKDYLVLSELKAGETVTLVNCTYNGTADVNVVIRNVDGQIVQEGNHLLADNGNGTYSVVNNG